MRRQLTQAALPLLLLSLPGCAASLDRAVDGLESGAVAVAVLGDEAGERCADVVNDMTEDCQGRGAGPECYDEPIALASKCEKAMEALTSAQAHFWDGLQLLDEARGDLGALIEGGSR